MSQQLSESHSPAAASGSPPDAALPSEAAPAPDSDTPVAAASRRMRDRIRELRRVRARELLPNPKNWRRHPAAQGKALRDLLSEIGYADALLARELPDGRLMLIDGHLRAETTPDVMVPVLVLDVTEDEADKLLLTLDPLAALAEADAARITALLQTVQTDSDAVQALLRRTAGDDVWRRLHPQTEPPAKFDQAGELQKKWDTRPGQLWQIGTHRLLCGDATRAEDVTRLMGGKRAVLFATDPPYAVGYTGGAHAHRWGRGGAAPQATDGSGDGVEGRRADIDNSEAAGLALYRGFIGVALAQAITRNAAWYCWHASKRQAMVERVWTEFSAFVHQQIIWVKTRAALTHSVYLWQHEPCLFGWLTGEKPTTLRAEVSAFDGACPTTVWTVPSTQIDTDAHPTAKPCRLFSLPMEMHTEPGALCYEPFSGSGAQLVAAEQTGRRCYAIEQSAPFVAVALERLAAMGLTPEVINS